MAMSLKELEEELKDLKRKVAENAWAKDYLEIWKLQSLYSHLYHIGRNSEIPSLFAQKTQGVKMEIEDSGVYEGLKSVTYFWNKVFDVSRMHGTPGFLAIHMTVNPLIEINRNRTKAKGLWHSHGVCSFGAGGEFKQFLWSAMAVVKFFRVLLQDRTSAAKTRQLERRRNANRRHGHALPEARPGRCGG